MSSRITFIDNSDDGGDWVVILLDGEVVHEGHSYPQGSKFVEFFKAYQGFTEHIEHIKMDDEQINNWRKYFMVKNDS